MNAGDDSLRTVDLPRFMLPKSRKAGMIPSGQLKSHASFPKGEGRRGNIFLRTIEISRFIPGRT
jgi:hypothetical protein